MRPFQPVGRHLHARMHHDVERSARHPLCATPTPWAWSRAHQASTRETTHHLQCGCLTAVHSQAGFVPEEVNAVIKESIDGVLLNQAYNEQKVVPGLLQAAAMLLPALCLCCCALPAACGSPCGRRLGRPPPCSVADPACWFTPCHPRSVAGPVPALRPASNA